MPKLILSLSALILCTLKITAQQPAQLLNSWSEKSPVEKIYLHFDRDTYIAGETAWFKAYMYSDFYPDTVSTSLYVELIRDANIISLKTVPVVDGVSRCQFELPDSLPSGSYLVRAYSPTMLNHDDNFLFHRWIYISGKTAPQQITFAANTRVEFFRKVEIL